MIEVRRPGGVGLMVGLLGATAVVSLVGFMRSLERAGHDGGGRR